MANTIYIFDLDDTVYPADSGIWDLIAERIDLYLYEKMRIPWEKIPEIRQSYFSTYGTTLRGLQVLHHVDPHDYLAFVHDIPIDRHLNVNPKLQEILASIPDRKVIFTNADQNHARRVLAKIGIESYFDQIVDILDIAPFCKPQPEAYHTLLKILKAQPEECIMIDDAKRNLDTAKNLGFSTILVGKNQPQEESHLVIEQIEDLFTILPLQKIGKG